MLLDEIFSDAKQGEVKVFFDMDGVCAEFKIFEKGTAKDAINLYTNSRPIMTILNIMQLLSQTPNVEVYILSSCHNQTQKQEKLAWLGTHAPFLKIKNIHIIKLGELSYTKETKNFIKPNYIKNLTEGSNATIYLIEDDHGIIRATKSLTPHIKANHVSCLIP